MKRKLKPSPRKERICTDIAVVGMGCIFPEANNTEEYWNNILSGDEFVKDMPEHLWPMKQFWSAERQDHKSVTIQGCFLKEFDFDKVVNEQ